jgi:hypothetical protein
MPYKDPNSEHAKAKRKEYAASEKAREKKKEYQKEYYQKTKDAQLEAREKGRKPKRDYLRRAKSVPCMDCGILYPFYVMDFDHRDPSDKSSNVSKLVKTGTLQELIDEIAKCDVVCSNCHRERTYNPDTGHIKLIY